MSSFSVHCIVLRDMRGALGSTYDVIISASPVKKGRKMAEVLVSRVILLLLFISVMSQVCTDSRKILRIFSILDIFFNKDLKCCALLIREMGKMLAIWEFFTSKDLKIGKIFASLTMQCGPQFQRISIRR